MNIISTIETFLGCFFLLPKVETQTGKILMTVNEEHWISVKTKGIFSLKLNGNTIENKGGILIRPVQAGDFKLEIKGIGIYGKRIKQIELKVIEAQAPPLENVLVDILNPKKTELHATQSELHIKKTAPNVKNDFLILQNQTIKKKQPVFLTKRERIKLQPYKTDIKFDKQLPIINLGNSIEALHQQLKENKNNN